MLNLEIGKPKGKEIKPEDVTVVVPTLNEEGAIGGVLRELKESGYSNIIVVDGGSTDRTVEIAKDEGVPVLMQEGKGKSDAVKTAVPYIPTPYALIMDGDHTYDPGCIAKMLRRGDYWDEVIGVRERENIPILHRFGNWAITKLFNLLFDTSLHDVCSGMYLIRTEFLREFDFSASGFSLEVGLAAHTASVSRRITEERVCYRKRIGKPKLRSLHGFKIVADSLKLAWSYNPAFLIFLLSSLLLVPSSFILAWVAYRYFLFGVSHFVWAIIGSVGIGVGLISLLFSLLSLFIKRVEYRLVERMRNGKHE
ncbi:MAG: glycosyltransferase family 2 protein [Candidatus Methanosuratincola petrocarbonis]